MSGEAVTLGLNRAGWVKSANCRAARSSAAPRSLAINHLIPRQLGFLRPIPRLSAISANQLHFSTVA
jgi:hypothetical protein